MLFNSIVEDILKKMRITLNENEQSAMIANVEKINDYYDNKIADPNKAPKYFEHLPEETDEKYGARKKVAAPWLYINISKIDHYFWKGNTENKWVPIDEEKGKEDKALQGLADEANEVQQAIFRRNAYHKNKHMMLRNTLKFGVTLGRPKYHKYDTTTGEEIDLAEGFKGIPVWTEIEREFFWLIYDEYEYDKVAGCILVYDFDNGKIYATKDGESDERKHIVEVITRDQYNPTNKKKTPGIWRAWENENELDDSGPNEYGFFPCIVWTTVDGEGLFGRVEHLMKTYNEELSALMDALYVIDYPMLKIKGDVEDDLVMGPRRAIKITDEKGDADILSPSLDIEAHRFMTDKLERLLSFTFGVPLEVLHGLVEQVSGIQLKMLFASLIQLRESLQFTIGEGERDYMWKSLRMVEIKNNKLGHWTDKLRPVVVYDDNIIPVDEAEQLEQDITKELRGYKSKKQNVVRYNPDIETEEEAENFIQENSPAVDMDEIENIKNDVFGKKKPEDNDAE